VHNLTLIAVDQCVGYSSVTERITVH
jgi:hypothetical protein